MKCFLGVFCGVAAFAALSTVAFARPALPNTFCAKQSDGSCVTVQQFGDEHYHYTTTIDGYLVVEDSTGDLVYADSEAVATKVKAKNADGRSDSDKVFLKKLNQRRVLEKHKSKNVDRFPSQTNFLKDFRHKIEENRKALFRPKPASHTMGECHFPVFLVSSSDRDFGDTVWYRRSLNEIGFSEDGHYGSVRDYFLASSDSLFDPVFEVFPVKVSVAAKFSAQPEPSFEGAFVKAVLDAAAPSMGDLSRFDKNGDKVVDGFGVIIPGMEQGTNLWGHMYNYTVFSNPEMYSGFGGFGGFGGGRGSSNWNNDYDGYRFDEYLIIAENADPTSYSKEGHNGIGVFIHEFSHVLGLPDFYSQVGNGPFIEGPVPYDIMTQGMYNGYSNRTYLMARQPPKYSAFERESMGWLTIPELKATDDVYSLEMIDANKAYGVTNPKDNDEYYVVEYRPRVGWDAAIPDSAAMGVLVWYINYDAEAWEYFPNQEPGNPRYKVENVINVSSKKASRSFDGFKFGDLGVYNVIAEENKRVCFATKSNVSVKCPEQPSSSESAALPKSSSSVTSKDKAKSSSSEGKAKSSSSGGKSKSSDSKDGLKVNSLEVSSLVVLRSEIVVLSSSAAVKFLNVVDVLGNEVRTVEFSSGELHVPFSELPRRGAFFIRLYEGGKLVSTQKIVVK